jgi:lipopolysaccharide/colanic/teichoic acid biosynthesis glycosyltransferase
MGRQNGLIKRLTDVTISILILAVFSPVLLLATIAIKIESKGPVFFLHERTGYKGKKFKLFKLRGMVANALDVGPEITRINDSRITKVGKILRRTSIDEIPNFINVLRGEMSLVGPRPDIVSITDNYTVEQKKVLDFLPGVTGISQINGRQTLTPSERVKMEIKYYSNATFLQDLVIILKTFKVIWNNKGNV